MLQIDIPIRVLGCETSLVTFTGIGYDKRVMGNTLSLGGHIVDIPTRQKASVKSQVNVVPDIRNPRRSAKHHTCFLIACVFVVFFTL